MKIALNIGYLFVFALALSSPLLALDLGCNPLVWFRSNFHEVEKGRCYRAKTLSKSKLEKRIRKHNIKTILNLREADPGARWYQDEVAICKKHGVTLHTVTLDASKKPTSDQIEKILSVFDTTQGPLLIHCRAGADRTGLVSALWKTEKMGASLKQALDQQKIKYGHIALRFPQMRAFTKEWHALKITYHDDKVKMLNALP